MNMRKYVVSGFLAAGMLWGIAAAAGESAVGKWFYTRCNIWYENPKGILSTNFHRGGRIPAGSKVKITGISDSRITFDDPGTGSMMLAQVRRHTNMPFQEFFDRMFSEKDPKAADSSYSRFTKDEQVNVETGTVAAGMCKDAVLMAYGHPPTHRTPDLKSNRWTYWKDRSEMEVVNFDQAGKVKGQNVEGSPDSAAAMALNPVGKQFYTAVNIWVDDPRRLYSINYHKGKMLPVGTLVDVTAFGDDEIRFVTRDNREYTLLHLTKYSNVGLDQLFWRYFSEKDETAADGAMAAFADVEKEGVKKGIVEEGMSKKAVLMAYGYPPGNRTPDLDHHIWTFWVARGRRLVVYFRNDHVISYEPET